MHCIFRDAFSRWSYTYCIALAQLLRHLGQPGSTKVSCAIRAHEPYQSVADVCGQYSVWKGNFSTGKLYE